MSGILEDLIRTSHALVANGLVRGAGGNVSAREDDVMWISPSGFSFLDAQPEDYPGVSIARGEIVRGERRPSSEVLMHLAIYRRRPEIRAVIHTHPPITIALTAAGHELRPMYPDYYVYLGRNVPHLRYITPTTPELAAAVEEVAQAPDCHGIVLRNHGTITLGVSVKEAYFRALAVEEQAFIQHAALQVGQPYFLKKSECVRLDELESEAYRRELLARMKG
ncbi:MAG: class II aldolase/adducin family protein [Candidatus Latescibacterota bacterium]|jgi:L-fuculose-phosphate aldolase